MKARALDAAGSSGPDRVARASPLAGQEQGRPERTPLVLTADTPRECGRVCRKGKACGNGCISATKQVQEGAGLRLRRGPLTHSAPPFAELGINPRHTVGVPV
jgi:hypothetical protein